MICYYRTWTSEKNKDLPCTTMALSRGWDMQHLKLSHSKGATNIERTSEARNCS